MAPQLNMSLSFGRAGTDASADMLDDDTGFRCVAPAETLRALIAVKS